MSASPAQKPQTGRDLASLAVNAVIVMGFYAGLGAWRHARYFWIAWAVAAALAIAYLVRRSAFVRRGRGGSWSGADVALRLGWILCSLAALALALFRV